jgi:hypothetical protein
MRISRHVIFVVCLTLSIAVVVWGYFEEKDDQLIEVLYCALCVLMSIGILAFVLQFITKRISSIMTYVFFGFFAGISATNFIFNVVSRITYESWIGYLADYGPMAFFFVLPIAGIALIQATDDKLKPP